MRHHALIVILALAACAGAQEALPALRLLTEFGDTSTPAVARQTFTTATAALRDHGGFIILTDAVSAEFTAGSVTQQELGDPGVPVVDLRQGVVRIWAPSLGIRAADRPHGYATVMLDREVSQDSINPNGNNAIVRFTNELVHGSTSYRQELGESVATADPAVRRFFPTQIGGLAVGTMLGTRGGILRVEKLGWDADRRRVFVDLRKRDEARDWDGVNLATNKSTVNTLYLRDVTHCDVEAASTVHLEKYLFGRGDNFGFGQRYMYMGDIFSTSGDERGNAYTADTWHLLNSFLGHVESWDAATQTLTYTTDSQNANTLGTSRLMVNLNPDKWVTAGRIVVHGRFDYGGSFSGDYWVEGLDTQWTPEIVGRALAVDQADEYCGNSDNGFWQPRLAGRKVRRWWRITACDTTDDGRQRLYVARLRWYVYEKSAPTLMNRDNYGEPLPYVIAPCGMVMDVREALLPDRKINVKGDSVMPQTSDPRRVKVLSLSPADSALDFAAGDAVEQAVGADPAQPNGYRVRHRESMPSALPSASFLSVNNGYYPVHAGLLIGKGGDRPAWPSLPGYWFGVNIDATTDYGIRIGRRVNKAAILIEDRQHEGQPQPIQWRTAAAEPSEVVADPATGVLRLRAPAVAVGALTETAGLSATPTPARNLRGIAVPVPVGADRLQVTYPAAEIDAGYSLTVQPSWLTTDGVIEKTRSGFTVRFGTPAPADATLDWQLLR